MKPRVLISAYACEPGKGSEPGVGWNWVINLAPFCELTVVTRSNNRNSIANAIGSDPAISRIRWIYHDLGSLPQTFKKALGAHRLYYTAWQYSLGSTLKKLCAAETFDIVHHLTFASYRYPTALSKLPGIKIWGPVGGAERTPWHLLPWAHPSTLFHEIFRNLQTNNISGLSTAKRFTHILASTQETKALFSRHGLAADLMPTVGIDERSISLLNSKTSSAKGLRLLFVGNLQYLKGIHFVIEALTYTPVTTCLTLAGAGPYEKALKKLARRISVSERVNFLGHVPHKSLPSLHREHDLFVFPSLHDSGGTALLEAMASGMPSIVLACGGPRVICNASCAIQIAPGHHSIVVSQIADAIKKYHNDPTVRSNHGRAAMARVADCFIWKKKAEVMTELYKKLIRELV